MKNRIRLRDCTKVLIPQNKKLVKVDEHGRVLTDKVDFGKWLQDNHQAMNDKVVELKDATGKIEFVGMRAKVLASMSGVLINRRVYPGIEVKAAAHTAVTKPFHKNHDTSTDPVGRIENSIFEQVKSGSAFDNDFKHPALQIPGKKVRPSGILYFDSVFMDPDTIQKIQDKRFMHVSQGASAGSAICNVCGQDNAKTWCEHIPGRYYDKDGKRVEDPEHSDAKGIQMCFFIIRDMEYDECSIVSRPALREAMILETEDEELADAWKDHAEVMEQGAVLLTQDSFDGFELISKDGEVSYLQYVTDSEIEIGGNPEQNPEPDADKESSGSDTADDSSTSTREETMSEENIKDLKAEKIRLNDQVTDLQAEITVKDERIEAKDTEIKDLKAKHDELKKEFEELKKDHKSLEDSYKAKLEEERKELEDSYVAVVKASKKDNWGDEDEKKARERIKDMPTDSLKIAVDHLRSISEEESATTDVQDEAVKPNKGTKPNGGTSNSKPEKSKTRKKGTSLC